MVYTNWPKYYNCRSEAFGIISAWWLRTSSKFCGQEFEEIHRNIGLLGTPKQVRIPPIDMLRSEFLEMLIASVFTISY